MQGAVAQETRSCKNTQQHCGSRKYCYPTETGDGRHAGVAIYFRVSAFLKPSVSY